MHESKIFIYEVRKLYCIQIQFRVYSYSTQKLSVDLMLTNPNPEHWNNT